MPDRVRTTDPGHERRYFTMVPHLVTDMLLAGTITPVAFALYSILRRECGEDGGECSGRAASLSGLARRLGVAKGTIFTARGMLVEHELVDLHLEGPEGHEVAHITVRDVWPENMAKYAVRKPHDGLRSNIDRKSRRQRAVAVSGDRTQTIDFLTASGQHLTAARPLTGEPEKPENRQNVNPEFRGAAAPNSAVASDRSDPMKEIDDEVVEGAPSGASAADQRALAYRIQNLAQEFEDPAVASCISRARRLFEQSALELFEFDNVAKTAAHNTRRRMQDMTKRAIATPMAYFFAQLETLVAERAKERAADGAPDGEGTDAPRTASQAGVA